MRRFLAGILVSIVVLHRHADAQTLPDEETIMKKMAEAAQQRRTLQYVLELNVDATQAFQKNERESGQTMVTVAFVNPDRLFVEEKGLTGTIVQVFDGSTTWRYETARKQYTRTAAAQRLSFFSLPLSGLLRGLPVFDANAITSVLREETVDIDGTKYDCWVVVSALNASSVSEGVITSWIDKESLMGVRHEASLALLPLPTPFAAAPPELRWNVRMILHSLKIDGLEPEATKFVFVPPSDFSQVPFLGAQPRTNMVGTPAPPFEAKDLSGKTYSLSSLRGKPVLLDFWTTWCKPCAESSPIVQRLAEEFKGRGLVVLAIDVDEDRKSVENFLKSKPLPYPVILGKEYDVPKAFQVTGYPTFVAIDANGTVVAYEVGYDGEASLRTLLAKAGLGSAPPPASANATPKPSTPPAPTYLPAGIAIDRNDNLYVADRFSSRVTKISKDGHVETVAGTGIRGFGGDGGPAAAAQLNQPSALAIDIAGNLYIADTGNNRVRMVSADGVIRTAARDVTVSGVTLPLQGISGIAVDGSGNLYIAEGSAHRVSRIGADRTAAIVAGTGMPGNRGDEGPAITAQLKQPGGLAVDPLGNLYIADTGNHRVRMVRPNGVIVTVAGIGAAGSSGDGGEATFAQLNNPTAIAIDSAGDLYIAQGAGYRVRKVSRGTITTIAGTGVAGREGDGGPAAQAQLNNVLGIVIDEQDTIFFADTGNGRIRSITKDGVIHAFHGASADIQINPR